MSLTADSSSRFVLPPDAHWLNNLPLLWQADPDLAAQIEALPDDSLYPVESSRTTDPTLAVTSDDNRRIYLHSRYEPLKEAQRLADAVNITGHLAYYVQGLGLGYHVQALLNRISSEALLCIFEPDLKLIKTALWERDLGSLFQDRRILFFTRPDKGQLFSRLQPFMALLSMGFQSLTHAPSIQAHPQFHHQMQTWIAEYASYCGTSLQTLLTNGRRTAVNIARNLGWYIATPSIARLKDLHKNRPAIVVSAGPSLRKNKHLLKDLQDRAVLVAVQTTLQPLLEMGVEPHYVTSLDYHEISTRFFEKLPKKLHTQLVAEPKATERIFRLYTGPATLVGNDFAEKLLREMKLDKPQLPAGATVAHLAYYLAEYLGCDPIIFVGQDLGFSDGLCYAPGTSYEDVWRPELSPFCTMEMKQWEHIVRDRRILRRIPDIAGRPMYTEERLYTYLQQFERDFLLSKRTIIDATEGGALKRGARIMTLADTITQFCPPDSSSPIALNGAKQAGGPQSLDFSRLPQAIDCLNARRTEAAQIEQISRDTLPLLEEVAAHIDDQPRVNRLIARIDQLRARMNQLGPCYDLILQISQSAELNRFQQDRRIHADALVGIERQRQQVRRDIENVRSITSAAADFVQLMSDVITHLTPPLPHQEAA